MNTTDTVAQLVTVGDRIVWGKEVREVLDISFQEVGRVGRVYRFKTATDAIDVRANGRVVLAA